MSSDDDEGSQNNSTGCCYSPLERRRYYRKFLGKAKVLQENVNKVTIKNLDNIMGQADDISNDEPEMEKVNYCDEILLDSGLMSASSDILKRCTETLNKDSSPYNSIDFADRILAHISLGEDTESSELRWSILGDDIFESINVTPYYSCLLGALKPLEKQVVERRKQTPRDPQVATSRPETVRTVDKIEDGVEETVQKIKMLIAQYFKNHETPLDFFKLILNPENFGRTIENILHVSFLVRDGFVKMANDEQGKLMIYPSSKEAIASAKKKGNAANIQNVIAINQQQWTTLVKAYQITSPMINFVTSGNS